MAVEDGGTGSSSRKRGDHCIALRRFPMTKIANTESTDKKKRVLGIRLYRNKNKTVRVGNFPEVKNKKLDVASLLFRQRLRATEEPVACLGF